jgi:hypothetical protein
MLLEVCKNKSWRNFIDLSAVKFRVFFWYGTGIKKKLTAIFRVVMSHDGFEIANIIIFVARKLKKKRGYAYYFEFLVCLTTFECLILFLLLWDFCQDIKLGAPTKALKFLTSSKSITFRNLIRSVDSVRFMFKDTSKAFSRPALIAKDGVRSQVNICRISSGKMITVKLVSSEYFGFSCQYRSIAHYTHISFFTDD